MNVAVFCASAEKVGQEYFGAARRLGEGIACRSWNLVYGGTNCGLMRMVAEATLAGGGKVKGVIPRCIEARGVSARNITELVVAEDMKERKQLMREQADAFVALPGGWGTLEEMTEVITLKQLGMHRKPVVFINTGGFYDLFWKFMEQAAGNGFVSDAYCGLYEIVRTPEEALEYIASYRPEVIRPKYFSCRDCQEEKE